MTPVTPVTTGQVSAFAVTAGTLPAGITINQTTGVISGTPTVAQAAANVTITVAGPGGSATAVISFTVNAPPTITTQPVNVSAPAGTNSGKFFVAASGTAPFTYKWIRTSRTAVVDTLTNTGIFTTATTDTLRFTNATKADSASTFKCMVTNVAGFVVSNAATLTTTTVGILGPYVVHVKGLSPFSFRVPENGATSVRMSAEDMKGRVVWDKDVSLAKSRVVSWNGSGHDGHAVSSGMYVVRMKMLNGNKIMGETHQTNVFSH